MLRSSRASIVLSLLLFIATNAWAATTYTVSGATYNPANRSGLYAAATGITGSFTTAAPLPAGLSGAAIAGGTGGLGDVTSWSFNDGVFTYTNLNSAIYLNDGSNFSVSTNGSGVITDFSIILTMPSSGAAVGQPTEFMFLAPTSVTGLKANCTVLAPGGATCQNYDGTTVDQANNSPLVISASFAGSGPPPPPTTSVAVSTLSNNMLAVIALLLAATGFFAFRRK